MESRSTLTGFIWVAETSSKQQRSCSVHTDHSDWVSFCFISSSSPRGPGLCSCTPRLDELHVSAGPLRWRSQYRNNLVGVSVPTLHPQTAPYTLKLLPFIFCICKMTFDPTVILMGRASDSLSPKPTLGPGTVEHEAWDMSELRRREFYCQQTS